MIRFRALALAAALAALCSTATQAQTFGQFTGAEPLAVNARMFGAYVVASENVASLLAHLRLSFYPGVDFGFQGGIARQDYASGDRTNVRLGTDLKVAVRPQSDENPFAISMGGALSVETGDNFTILSLGPTLSISRSYPMGPQTAVTPYAGVGFAFSNIDVGIASDSDFSIPVHVGAETGLAPGVKLVTELQLHLADDFGDNFGFLGGVNLPF